MKVFVRGSGGLHEVGGVKKKYFFEKKNIFFYLCGICKFLAEARQESDFRRWS